MLNDTTRKCSSKKGSSRKKSQIQFSAKFKAKKKDHDLCPILTNQKIVLFSTEDCAFSRTCRVRGQGLQNVSSRPKTSSRTPTLVSKIWYKKDCCNFVLLMNRIVNIREMEQQVGRECLTFYFAKCQFRLDVAYGVNCTLFYLLQIGRVC